MSAERPGGAEARLGMKPVLPALVADRFRDATDALEPEPLGLMETSAVYGKAVRLNCYVWISTRS
jgi:hypothetical protein